MAQPLPLPLRQPQRGPKPSPTYRRRANTWAAGQRQPSACCCPDACNRTYALPSGPGRVSSVLPTATAAPLLPATPPILLHATARNVRTARQKGVPRGGLKVHCTSQSSSRVAWVAVSTGGGAADSNSRPSASLPADVSTPCSNSSTTAAPLLIDTSRREAALSCSRSATSSGWHPAGGQEHAPDW